VDFNLPKESSSTDSSGFEFLFHDVGSLCDSCVSVWSAVMRAYRYVQSCWHFGGFGGTVAKFCWSLVMVCRCSGVLGVKSTVVGKWLDGCMVSGAACLYVVCGALCVVLCCVLSACLVFV
jgi:hypothetical protein